MNDRESLELAAKAAGISEYLGAWFDDGISRGFLSGRLGNGRSVWNPRDDDGDALRLAVKCHLHFAIMNNSAIASNEDYGVFEQVPFGDIRQEAATRLAIFQAAVEIGKAMV